MNAILFEIENDQGNTLFRFEVDFDKKKLLLQGCHIADIDFAKDEYFCDNAFNSKYKFRMQEQEYGSFDYFEEPTEVCVAKYFEGEDQ